MRIEDFLYDVREVDLEEVPEELKFGKITILGNDEDFGRYAHKTYQDFLQGIDIKDTILTFDLNISNEYPAIAEEFGCNIAASYPNLFNGRSGVIVASAPPDEFGLAAAAVAKEIERRMKQTNEAMIALAALGAPSDYHYAVEMLFDRRQRNRYNYGSSISFHGRGPGAPANVIPPRGEEPRRNFDRLSEQAIRDVYHDLPSRYSDLYERRNQEAIDIVRHSLDVIDQKTLVELLFEVAKKDRNFFRKLEDARQSITAKYRIYVRKWSSEQMKDFKDQYRYCIYVKDYKGNEIPVKFKNSPSYCIFMMHVIDRRRRGNQTTALSFMENKEEFKRLYRFVMNETYEQIDSFCEEMVHRKMSNSNNLRKGRYDDYIKDINDTFDQMLGQPDSLALKIGHGQFLNIPPSNIKIEDDMPEFNFT